MNGKSETPREETYETKESESEFEEEKVLYEIDASELSNKDKTYRRIRAIGLLSFYLIIAFVLFLFLDVLAMIVVFAIMWFSPHPFIPIFAKYKITERAIVDNRGRRLEITPEYKFIINEKHNFVGLKRGRRYVLWLYTNELEKVIRVLEKVSKESYDRLLKEKGIERVKRSK